MCADQQKVAMMLLGHKISFMALSWRYAAEATWLSQRRQVSRRDFEISDEKRFLDINSGWLWEAFTSLIC